MQLLITAANRGPLRLLPVLRVLQGLLLNAATRNGRRHTFRRHRHNGYQGWESSKPRYLMRTCRSAPAAVSIRGLCVRAGSVIERM